MLTLGVQRTLKSVIKKSYITIDERYAINYERNSQEPFIIFFLCWK